VYLEQDLLSTRLSIRKRGGSLGHYQSMEKEERFSQFRSRLMGSLIMTLGAMAAEHVFYGENTDGVAGDVQSATNLAALMVGWCAMGPEPVHLSGSADVEEDVEEVFRRLERIGTTIMSRARVSAAMAPDPVAAVLGDRNKHRDAAILLGQAYVTAYTLISTNRPAVEEIAETLIERKEMYGDEVVDLLGSVGLVRPQIDLMDDRTWPAV
jgi:ATP-dependent Zn protease